MSLTQFKETTYSLTKLVEDIHRGEIGLPELQRPFVWGTVKVRDLFDSMYHGFPVGYLLLWENSANGHSKSIGTGDKPSAPRLLVIDGQQRLTALYAVIKGQEIMDKDFAIRRVEIAFNPLIERFEVPDAAIRRDPLYISDISEIWLPDTKFFSFVNDYCRALDESRGLSDDERNSIESSLQKLHSLTNYPFTALELSADLDEEQVADVFVRINSKGTPLNQADFILTLMSVFWDEGRKQLENFSLHAKRPTTNGPSPNNRFFTPEPDDLLRVSVALGFRRAALRYFYPLLRGKDIDSGSYIPEKRDQQFAKLKEAQEFVLDLQNWHEFFKAIIKAGYREGKYITSQMGLVYTYAIYLIGRKNFQVPTHQLRKLIARWFFMEALTGRYTNSPESAMESDLADLRGINSIEDFVDRLNKTIKAALTDDFWSINLPDMLTSSAGWSPALFAYYASLNLLDAKVLFSETGMKVTELMDPLVSGERSALERHHLFPKAYLNRLGISGNRRVNQIANFALVEWSDNSDISDLSPAEYAPAYEAKFNEDDLQKMYYWHALPEDWYQLDYEDFLEQRRDMMATVIRDAFRLL